MLQRFTSYSLLQHNTFGIDAVASSFIDFSSEDELMSFVGNGYFSPSLVIGGGSNLLFTGDYAGTVFHSSIKSVEVACETDDNVYLRVGSGVNWDELVAYTVESGWGGLENLSAIPGEVGASAVQNVGAYGTEVAQRVQEIEVFNPKTGEVEAMRAQACDFAYRHSIFKDTEKGRNVITFVTYRLSKRPQFKLEYGNLKDTVDSMGGATLHNVRAAVCGIRDAKLPDPLKIGSAGSFFMNPVVNVIEAAALKESYPTMPQYPLPSGDVKLSAGWLIEQCGWKKKPHEHVGVYSKQALVVINLGGATGNEVLAFASEVVESVRSKFGVNLNMEVNVI